jgi:hypothetical protein
MLQVKPLLVLFLNNIMFVTYQYLYVDAVYTLKIETEKSCHDESSLHLHPSEMTSTLAVN